MRYLLVLVCLSLGCGGKETSAPVVDTVDNYTYCQALAEEPSLTQKQAQKWNQLDCAEVLSQTEQTSESIDGGAG